MTGTKTTAGKEEEELQRKTTMEAKREKEKNGRLIAQEEGRRTMGQQIFRLSHAVRWALTSGPPDVE